jgi:hypothetical protein
MTVREIERRVGVARSTASQEYGGFERPEWLG